MAQVYSQALGRSGLMEHYLPYNSCEYLRGLCTFAFPINVLYVKVYGHRKDLSDILTVPFFQDTVRTYGYIHEVVERFYWQMTVRWNDIQFTM